MKAAVLTLATSNNYGAVLQTYATAKTLQSMGVTCEIYNYLNKKRLICRFSTKRKIRYYLYKFLRNLFTFRKKDSGFELFRKNFLPLTKQKYKNNRQIRSNPGDYDLYIAGSDQIWNPDIFVYDTTYFLDFVPKGKRKISYASSFGKGVFKTDKEELCANLLNEFEAISVREKSGVGIIKELTGRQAEHVLDPTLLLKKEQWLDLLNKSKKRNKFKGIFCYVMPGDKKVETEIELIAKRLQKQTGLPILRLGIKEFKIFKYGLKGCDITAGPLDFLSYFYNAEYVVTNSFHGTAFSLLFEKKFYVPINKSLSPEKKLHERIISLLTSIQAMDALVPVGENAPLKQLNMEEVQLALENERNKSLEFLRKAVYGNVR